MTFHASSSSVPVTHWLDRDGVAISWREAGQGAGIVLLHAFPLSAAMWAPLVQRWKHAFRILCPVWRGFDGPSPLFCRPENGRGTETSLPLLGAAQSDPSLTHYADDVAAICAVSGISSAIFLGCSIGGYVMLELMRRHPSLVRAAIFCGTRPEADSGEGRAARLETNRWLQATAAEAGESAASAALAERMLPRLLGESTRLQHPQIVEQVRAWIAHAPVDAVLCANASMAARPDSRSLLPGLHLPALVIAGEEDVIAPPPVATEFARQIPGADLRLVAGAGHLLPVEAPDAFAHEVETWLHSRHLLQP